MKRLLWSIDNAGIFGTFGRKTLAIMLICIGDGIRDSLFQKKSHRIGLFSSKNWQLVSKLVSLHIQK